MSLNGNPNPLETGPLVSEQQQRLSAHQTPNTPFKKKRAPPSNTTGTKPKKMIGGSAKAAAAGKQQRKSVKAASAKPVSKKPKTPKTKKPPTEAPGAPKKKTKKQVMDAAATLATELTSSTSPAAGEGAKFDAIVEMLVQLANDRLARGAVGAAPAAAAAAEPEVRSQSVPHHEGHVTGL